MSTLAPTFANPFNATETAGTIAFASSKNNYDKKLNNVETAGTIANNQPQVKLFTVSSADGANQASNNTQGGSFAWIA